MSRARRNGRPLVVAHVTTVDMSLRFLLLAQLRAVRDSGGVAIGISAPGPWVADLEAEGIRHVPIPTSTRSMNVVADMQAARELWRIVRREQVDVLHTHNPKPGVYGRVVGRAAGVPIVVNTVHGLYATEDDPVAKRSVVYGLEGIAARCSDAELFQNPEDLALARRLHLTRHAQLLGNGVDLGRFDPARFAPDARHAARADLGVTDDNTVVIGAVGRLVAEKGYPELLEAAAGLPPDRVVLVIAGTDDPEKPDTLARSVVAAARADGVRMLGHRSDVERLYAAMDVFVLASHREGFPRAAMEAAAMGLPVVATDIRGCRQVVVDGVTGVLVPVGDPGALRDALAALVDDPVLRRGLGRAGRARALTHFDERDVVRTVLDAYAGVAARKGLNLPPLRTET
jgi:glycosyltransferase involved in cell wall biosynthesis